MRTTPQPFGPASAAPQPKHDAGAELEAEQLRRHLDPTTLRFRTTAEVAPLEATMGQPRALAALRFALEVTGAGYNAFVAGTPGSGRSATARACIQEVARGRPRPDSWVYVHNFRRPERPRALRLPPGTGRRFAQDMDSFVDGARARLRGAFEDEAYAQRERALLADIAQRREQELEELRKFALLQGFAVQLTPGGIVSVPVMNGHPIQPAELEALSDVQRQDLQRRGEAVQEHLEGGLRRLHQLDHEAGERVERLNVEVANFAIAPQIAELRERYAGQDLLLAYLDEVRADVPRNLNAFRADPAAESRSLPVALDGPAEALARYRVNVLVEEAEGDGAPVVTESNPTYYNLLGRIEYESTLGMLRTDFRRIRAGALHRANGGFLVLDAAEVLANPFAWDALRRALHEREIRVQNLAEQVTLVPTPTLDPEPIPLDVKVVLVGTPEVCSLLYKLDLRFRELFKVRADFAPDLPWSDETVAQYAASISRWVRERALRHFDAGAVGRVVEHGARLREHQAKLSAHLLDLSNLVEEASYWAGKAGHEVVQAADVSAAIQAHVYRSNLLEERVREMIGEGTVVIETQGAEIGQVNGLSVIEVGDHQFGMPSRITASVAVGRGTLTSIERQIELSGPIHSKGFLTLGGYLSQQYGQNQPLAVRATISFEQSYEGVEGDSASSAELYALLSALSGLPVEQGIAVTGSVDQHGVIQAVGGVTEKIEGFFEVCRARGLNGRQGVMIPASNAPHLMLSDDVTDAVREGKFHVWVVRTADQGMSRLTGRPAGERGPDGSYPVGSVHRLVDDRLRGYVERLHSLDGALDGNSPTS